VDIEAVACVHNLQYKFSTSTLNGIWCIVICDRIRSTTTASCLFAV